MFHSTTSPRPPTRASGGNPFLKRAGFFAGALVLLWLAFQMLPAVRPGSDPLYTDTGTVAAKPKVMPAPQHSMHLVRPGYVVALLLLAGGGAFAIYLRRRNGIARPKSSPIQMLGTTQIAPGQQLRLVSCGDEVLLLGVTSSQINLLKSFPADAFKRDPRTADGKESNECVQMSTAENIGNSFASLLQQLGAAPSQHTQTTEHRWPA